MEKEIWVELIETDNKYSISNYGKIKNNNTGKIRSEYTGSPYITQNLYFNGKNKTIRPHRLVATYFLENPNNYPQVNHIDMNKHNNFYKNLEWCTAKYNLSEAKKQKPQMITGLIDYNKNKAYKNIMQIDKKTKKVINIFDTIKTAALETNTCERNIVQIISKTPFNKKGNVRKTAGGYIWKLKEEVVKNEI